MVRYSGGADSAFNQDLDVELSVGAYVPLAIARDGAGNETSLAPATNVAGTRCVDRC
jgi:hypothetical protein